MSVNSSLTPPVPSSRFRTTTRPPPTPVCTGSGAVIEASGTSAALIACHLGLPGKDTALRSTVHSAWRGSRQPFWLNVNCDCAPTTRCRGRSVPVEDSTIRATELRNIRTDEDGLGLMTYDPAYMATASCRSAITFLDGEEGILEYRGYPIEQLAEKSTYLEVAYLLVHGHLPSGPQLKEWIGQITHHTFVHENCATGTYSPG